MAGKKAPSKRMVTAIQLIAQGNSPTAAMRQAGYSESSIRNPKHNLLEKQGVLTIVQQMNLTLQHKGIDGNYLAEALADFAIHGKETGNAKEFNGAYDRLKEIMGIGQLKPDETPTRRVTFEEWIKDEPLKGEVIE